MQSAGWSTLSSPHPSGAGKGDGYLRQLSISDEGPSPEIDPDGRRLYKLADINSLRRHLAGQGNAKARYA